MSRDPSRPSSTTFKLWFVILLVCAVQACTDEPITQQQEYALELTRTATLHDSTLSFRRNPLTQFERLTTGEIAVGPLPASDEAAVLVLDASLRSARDLTRKGAGPKELAGFLVIGTDGKGGVVAGSWPLARAKQLSVSGTVGLTAPIPEMLAGIAVCNDKIMMTGTRFVDGVRLTGVFAGTNGDNSVRLLYSLHEPGTNGASRYAAASTQMLSVHDDRVIVAIPNQPSVAIADSACRGFRKLPVALDWFEPWEEAPDGLPWNGPRRPTTYAVRWHSDTIALLLTYRANPEAQYFTDQKSRTSPVAPAGLKVPLAETVLTAFDTRAGRVVAERVLEIGWHFLSADELYKRRYEAEETDFFTLRLVRKRE